MSRDAAWVAAWRIYLRETPKVRLEVNDCRLIEQSQAIKEKCRAIPIRAHEGVVGEHGEIRLPPGGHRVQRKHRHHAVGSGWIGNDVDERAARIPIRPPALTHQTNEIAVMEVKLRPERVNAVEIVIVALACPGEIIAHSNQKVRREIQSLRQLGGTAGASAPVRIAAVIPGILRVGRLSTR